SRFSETNHHRAVRLVPQRVPAAGRGMLLAPLDALHKRRSMFDELLNDLRFGLRTLFKNRGFALLAILTLGLGIGANTAIFSVIHGVLLKPLPYADSDRLVLVRQSAPLIGRADAGVSIKEYFTYRDQATDFDGLVEFHQ